MAVVFSQQDIEAYKAAMARHAAKNNRLVEKWMKKCADYRKSLEALSMMVPGASRDALKTRIESLILLCETILDDLRLPADAEISDFEWRNCK